MNRVCEAGEEGIGVYVGGSVVVKISCHGGQVPWSRSKAEEIIKKKLILAAGKIKKFQMCCFHAILVPIRIGKRETQLGWLKIAFLFGKYVDLYVF